MKRINSNVALLVQPLKKPEFLSTFWEKIDAETYVRAIGFVVTLITLDILHLIYLGHLVIQESQF